MRHLQPHMSNYFFFFRNLVRLSLDVILCPFQGDVKCLKLRDDSSKFFLLTYFPFRFFIGTPTETIRIIVFFSGTMNDSIILFLPFLDHSKRHFIRVPSEQLLETRIICSNNTLRSVEIGSESMQCLHNS